MQMKQCPNGHFYDQSKTEDCPYCNSESANVNATRSMFAENQDIGVTVPMNQSPFTDRTRPVNQVQPPAGDKTVALIKKEIGIDPVVGWIVCVEGKDKGRDYRMHADNNFIGRSETMDICIKRDDTISRENHAIISYDAHDHAYYFTPGEGRSIVRVNSKAVFNTVTLSAYDMIEIGSTKFVFMPLCGEEFTWRD